MRQIVATRDGSHTIAIAGKSVMYHSVHGAIQESVVVYIEAGLQNATAQRKQPQLAVFEMGFGTGLNAFLTAIYAQEKQLAVHYTAVETDPLSPPEALLLNYPEKLGNSTLFRQLHQCRWNEAVPLHPYFTVQKIQIPLADFRPSRTFDIVYYDAFAPSAQPELWTKEVFKKIYSMLNENGILVTYCAKGDVKRAMQAAGFLIEKLPGPKGKREMLRGRKHQPL